MSQQAHLSVPSDLNTFARGDSGSNSGAAATSPRDDDRRISRIADMVLPRPDMESHWAENGWGNFGV